jgi:hypothetical protein
MATVDTDGECVCTAGASLDRLASQLVGGLGLQEEDKEPPPTVRRVKWTASAWVGMSGGSRNGTEILTSSRLSR